MKPNLINKLVVSGGCAWQIVRQDGDDFYLTLVAGNSTQRETTLHRSMLSGRQVFQRVSDIDITEYSDAVVANEKINPDEIGDDPRAWAIEFSRRYANRPFPDETILFSWFCVAMQQARGSTSVDSSHEKIIPGYRYGKPKAEKATRKKNVQKRS